VVDTFSSVAYQLRVSREQLVEFLIKRSPNEGVIMDRLGKVRVLVVDDDKQRVEVFQRCLSQDFDVFEARPGVAARRLLETEDFDLLVSDKSGPNGAGKEGVEIVGSCPNTRSLFVAIERIAREKGDVLIVGEPGSGKALTARALHQTEGRVGTFVCVRLAEIDADQIESIVFERPMPVGGTLLLEGIEHLPLVLQERLVRERESGQLPSNDCRVICAAETESDRISAALLRHLSPRRIQLSPLRDRGEDIPRLAIHFVARASKRLGRAGISLSREAMSELCSYNWPGNVSELREVLEQALARCPDQGVIGAGLLSGTQSPIVEQVVEDIIGGCRGLDAAMAELEAAVIREALQLQRGNRSAAARQLKLPRQTLQDRMKKHGLWQL
jgi:DNA-binding NtrC family response regulator